MSPHAAAGQALLDLLLALMEWEQRHAACLRAPELAACQGKVRELRAELDRALISTPRAPPPRPRRGG